jgi:hypothetical protein
MRKENDIDFVSLLQDETFLSLVKNTNCAVNQLDILEKEFPEQKEAIAYAVEFLNANLSDQITMQPKDVSAIWHNIKEYSGQSRKLISHQFISHEFWKVAAVLIFVFASSVFTYQLLKKDSLDEIAATKTIGNDEEAMIILSDGSTHKLSAKDSLVEYSSNGGEVVVKNDQKEERLENLNNSKNATINQIIVPFGHRHQIILSDGTRVQLNSGSRLVFPAEFSEKIREVYLKGEGYFEVSKNPTKPFIVKTDFVDIKVLGTVFNISAYEDDKIATAVLVEGKVVVLQKNILFGSTEKNLSPGQGCFYSSATKTSDIRNVNIYDYVSWKDGVFLFKDKALINVISRLEKYYHKKILIEGGVLPNTLISGKLVLSDNIEDVIQYLAKTMETRYGKDENGVFMIKE